MLKPLSSSLRLPLLAVAFSGALWVLGRAVTLPQTSPDASQPAVAPLNTSVPIAGWEAIDSTALKPEPEVVAAQRYRYRQGSKTLDVELRYMPGDGNVSRFLFVYTPIRAANDQLAVKSSNTGFYGTLIHEGRAYLSACISPRGESTVTEHQFTQARLAADLQVQRLLPWLLGQEVLLDRRCLWTLMSMPIADSAAASNSKEVYKDLEGAWSSWYEWWQSNFPRP